MYTCKYCDNTFDCPKRLQRHQIDSEYCRKYREIMFVCQKCGSVFKNIDLSEDHVKDCKGRVENGDSLTSKISNLEQENKFFQRKCNGLEIDLANAKKEMDNLRLELKMEQFKNGLFAEIIKKQTNLKIKNIYKEEEDGIHVYNYEDGTIPVFVHDYAKGNKKHIKIEKSVKKEKKAKTGKTYRSVKNRIELAEEKPEEIEEKIKKIEENFDEIVHENFDVSVKDTIETIDKQMEELQKSRKYKHHLSLIRDNRAKLLGKLDIPDYTNLVNQHIKQLEDIFVAKKYDEKKIKMCISSSLSPLEQRLVFYGKYYDTVLEPEHVQKLKLVLKLKTSSYPKRYVPFDFTDICERVYNYGIAVFPVYETLSRALINPFGVSNIVYLNYDKDVTDDPYRFYTLEKIGTDGKRYWKLECRLDDFSKKISTHIISYCIDLFRKIYLDTFHDNHYRENYRTCSHITQQDCEQLLLNIIALSKPKSFCNVLRKIITKHCTINPSELDKFSLIADDKLHKRQFAKENDSDEEITRVIKRVFDEISDEDAEQVWSNLLDK